MNLQAKSKSFPKLRYWLGPIVFFFLGDIVTTVIGLSLGAKELHPIKPYLVNLTPIHWIYGMILLKAFIILFLLATVYIIVAKNYKYVDYVLLGLYTLVGLIVTVSNSIQLFLFIFF